MKTIKIKTSDLTGATLDWAVAKCEGKENTWGRSKLKPYEYYRGQAYSTDWAKGGPIIEREKIAIDCDDEGSWVASYNAKPVAYYGPTPLIAAMRAFVASQFGDEVDIPDELLTNTN